MARSEFPTHEELDTIHEWINQHPGEFAKLIEDGTIGFSTQGAEDYFRNHVQRVSLKTIAQEREIKARSVKDGAKSGGWRLALDIWMQRRQQ